MKDEFNELTKPTPNNNQQANEFNTPIEYTDSKEFHSSEEFNENASTSIVKKKSNLLRDAINNLIKAMTYTAATGTVAVIATLFILNIDIFNQRPEVDFHYVDAGEDYISYYINIEEGEEYKIRLYNDIESYEIDADSGFNSGEFLELKSDTAYKLAVCGDELYGNDVISEVEVRTKTKHEVIITPIDEFKVEYECKCKVDGCFHLRVDFIDTEGVYSDFKAYLVGDDESIIEYSFLGEYNTLQKIDISEIEYMGDKNNIKLVITCMYNGEIYTILERIVSI